MDSLDDLLQKKADTISIDNKLAEIDIANKELERFVELKFARVTAVKDKTVSIKVKSSVFASELRLQQIAYLSSLSKAIDREVTKLHIRIS